MAVAPQGFESQLSGLAHRYHHALRSYFQHRAPAMRDEAEDLAQEVFVRLAQRQGGSEIEFPQGYLFQTAANVLTDRYRRRAVRRVDEHIVYDDDAHALHDISPERVLIGQDEVCHVRATLDALPERVRQAFIMRRIDELSYAEISQRLGLSISSCEKYVLRAARAIAIHSQPGS